VTTKQQLDELTRITASLAKNAEAHDRQLAGLLSTVESHDRQIASIIRALDKQRGVVNALAASVIAHDDQIEALGDRIDQFLNRLRPQ
jgi:ABC-type transporter Mla subunit MlaD